MSSTVEVIVPWRGGCPHRERIWSWLRPQYDLPVTEAPGPDPWCKADAVMPAAARSPADILVIADADVWTNGLPAAIRAVEEGEPWAVPHDLVFRLSEASTEGLLCGGLPDLTDLDEQERTGTACGGVFVIRRDILLEVPFDPRFVGWGQEDEALGSALGCLYGPRWRGSANLIHLFHPPAPRLDRKRGSVAGWGLRRRYAAARRDPARMRALLNEFPHATGERL